MKQVIRIGLIDSDSAIRFGRKLLLDSPDEFQVVFESDGSASDFEKISEALIDVLVIENRLSGFSGTDFLTSLRASYIKPSEMPGVVLTCIYQTPKLALAALAAGACSLVSQEQGAEMLLQAIPKATRPAGVVSASKLREFLDELQFEAHSDPVFVSKLRQLDGQDSRIVELISKGATDRAIAEELALSAAKLQIAIVKILDSLGFSTRTQLLISLYRLGVADEA